MKIKKSSKYFLLFVLSALVLPFILFKLGRVNTKKDYEPFSQYKNAGQKNEDLIITEKLGYSINNIYNKQLNELYIYLNDMKYGNITDFKEILAYKNAEYISYKSDNIPNDFAKVLNQLPNLKIVNLLESRVDINLKNFDKIKELEAEVLLFNTKNKSTLSLLNDMNNLKYTSVKIGLSRFDSENTVVENKTLESLLLTYYTTGFMPYPYDYNIFKPKSENIQPIKLDTPNLKNLSIDGLSQRLSFEIYLKNNADLDSICLSDVRSVKFAETNEKAKTNSLILINDGFQVCNFEQLLDGLDLESIKTLVIKPNYYSEISNLEFISKLKNLEHLELVNVRILNIGFLDQLKNLKNLGIDPYLIEDLIPLKNLPNLEQLTAYNNEYVDETVLQQLNDVGFLIQNKNISDFEYGEFLLEKSIKLKY